MHEYSYKYTIHMYVHVHVYVSVCMCVCVCYSLVSEHSMSCIRQLIPCESFYTQVVRLAGPVARAINPA